MNHVHVRELAAWGFDRYPYRPAVDKAAIRAAKRSVAQRPCLQILSPICDELTAKHHAALTSHRTEPGLLAEVEGLKWSLAIVDLRLLLSFQRRLSLNPNMKRFSVPAANDWPALFHLAFAPPKSIGYSVEVVNESILLKTADPNLHVRRAADVATPFVVHAGSPFFEVAHYRGRWFLRDGYHRAYALMRAGIWAVPSVVVEATTLADLGSGQPQFFSEATLLSASPPLVTDFLDDKVTLNYERPVLTKTIRVTIRESFAPAISSKASL